MVLNMINSGERDEVFYDSVDYLSSFDEELACGLWRNELKSVKERRDAFMCLMGSVDLGDLSSERIAECSGTISSSSFGLFTVCNETVKVPNQCEREDNGDANVMVDESESDLSSGSSPAADEDPSTLATSEVKVDDRGQMDKNRGLNWWKRKKRVMSKLLSMPRKTTSSKAPGMSKVNVQVNKKKSKELSALYVDQEFQAHKGVVWTAKFSPDGQYLATGGQDGVVRVWAVASADAHEKAFLDHADSRCGGKGGKAGVRTEKTVHVPVVIPDRVFQIEEIPVHEFRSHCGDILDLAWSNSNFIVSSSSDNTVRLWHIGSDECLGVYHHSNFVTCVRFNPMDDGYFISGSVDGKIRLWSLSEGRVVDWDDVRDAVTAISYQSDGQGLVVGCLNGCCRFYDAHDCSLQLITHIQLPLNKKSSGNRISGIQFCQDHAQRVIITSEDSKVHIFDKTALIQKYRGLSKSRAQMSASVTPNGRHIISVGEDSRVYLWEYDDQKKNEKRTKSIRSCEYFPLQGVSVVVPWCGYVEASSSRCTMSCCSRAPPPNQDASRVSLPNWLSQEGSLRYTATWPEEMLLLQDSSRYHELDKKESRTGTHFVGACSPTWGLVIVAVTCDGMIKVLHNYGLLPMKVEANVLSNLR